MKNRFEKIEDNFCKYMWLISLIVSGVLEYLYYIGMITNVKEMMSDIITFSSVIFVVLSLILTLFISLKESELFERIREFFPYVNKMIYKFSNKVIFASMRVLIIAIIIRTMPQNTVNWIKYLVGIIGLYSFSYMVIGTMYLLKFITDMVVRNDDYKKNKRNKIE